MKCFTSEILSRYQDGDLDEVRSRAIREHLMDCLSCQEKMRSLGHAGLFYRIALAGRRHTECLDEEELGTYLSGRMALEDRRRVEGHLVTCSRCLHEVAALSDPGMLRRSAGSPVPDARALERFKRLADRRAERPVVRHVATWGLRAAAAVLLGVMAAGQMLPPTPLERPETTVASDTVSASDRPAAPAVLAALLTDVSLHSDSTVLEPDGSDLARFAHDAGLILSEIERMAGQPTVDRFELVQEDIVKTGILESVTRLKETSNDRLDRRFLDNCAYVLTLIVKAESSNLDEELDGLISEIRQLGLVETTRLIEMERGGSLWLARL